MSERVCVSTRVRLCASMHECAARLHVQPTVSGLRGGGGGGGRVGRVGGGQW